MVIFSFCFASKNVLKYLFLKCFRTSTKICPKKGQKTVIFHILQNTSYKKNRFVATPFDQKLVFFNLCFFQTHNIDVEPTT